MQQAMRNSEFLQKLPDEVLLVVLFNMNDLHDAFVSRFLQSEPYNLDLDKNWRLIPHGSSGIDSEAYRPFSHVQRGVPSKEFAEMLTRQRRKIYRELLSRWKTKAALKEIYKLFLEYRKPQDSPFNMVKNITAHKRHAALLETDLLSVD
jgi:hypothetical protein